MKIQPLPQSIYDRAVKMGIESINLCFAGGSDEGYLDVNFYSANPGVEIHNLHALASDVEDWAWEAYEYSGSAAGGGDYGDNISYNVQKKKAEHRGWYTEYVSEPLRDEGSFEVVPDDAEITPVEIDC